MADPEAISEVMMARELFGATSSEFASESAEIIALACSHGEYWPRVILVLAGTMACAIEASRLVVPEGTPEPKELQEAHRSCVAVCRALGPTLRKDQPTARV